MPEVLVIGENGQLGHELLTQLRAQNIAVLGVFEYFGSPPNVRTIFNGLAW